MTVAATANQLVQKLLNFRNVLQVFATNGDTQQGEERAANLNADLEDLATEADANGKLAGNGDIDLTFGGVADRRTGCGNWVSSKAAAPAAANCVYLIRAEQRYGNGDGTYTVEEQTSAVNALYDGTPLAMAGCIAAMGGLTALVHRATRPRYRPAHAAGVTRR